MLLFKQLIRHLTKVGDKRSVLSRVAKGMLSIEILLLFKITMPKL